MASSISWRKLAEYNKNGDMYLLVLLDSIWLEKKMKLHNGPVVAVKAPVCNAPAVTDIELALSAAVAVVVPTITESVSSFQTIAALSPAVPLSMIIPALFVFADAPVFNSIMLSSIVVFVVLIVDDVPPTVRLPLTLTFKLSSVMVFAPDPELNPSPAFNV